MTPFLFVLFSMLNRGGKAEVVQGLEDRLRKQRVSLFANFSGISVGKLAKLRRELKRVGAEFKVVKKTLLGRALEAAGLVELKSEELQGEVGVVFGYDNQVLPAKVVYKFIKENKTFKVLRGLFEGRIIDASAAAALANLPTREELLAEVARVLNAPMQSLVNVLQGNIKKLVVVLSKIKK